jgi:hypothetical protein
LSQQVCVIKTTLGAFNDTLPEIVHNDKLVQKGLFDIKTYLDSISAETARTHSIFEAKFLIEKHITQVNNALTVLQRNIDVVLDRVLHAQSGSIKPQIVHPNLLLESLRGSIIFSTRHYLTFPARQRFN